jgi:hypothetical protein
MQRAQAGLLGVSQSTGPATDAWPAAQGIGLALRVLGFYCLACLAVARATPVDQVGGHLWFSALLPQPTAGHHCPFCGMTRAFVCLAHFRLEQARRLNGLSPWLFAIFLVLAAGVVLDLSLSCPGRRSRKPRTDMIRALRHGSRQRCR